MEKQQRTYSLQITLMSGLSFVYDKLTMPQVLDTVTSFDKDLVEFFCTEDTTDV